MTIETVHGYRWYRSWDFGSELHYNCTRTDRYKRYQDIKRVLKLNKAHAEATGLSDLQAFDQSICAMRSLLKDGDEFVYWTDDAKLQRYSKDSWKLLSQLNDMYWAKKRTY